MTNRERLLAERRPSAIASCKLANASEGKNVVHQPLLRVRQALDAGE
jgi:hypothetical protein